MMKHAIRKELLEIVRDGRFRWGGALVLGLLLLSLVAGWAHRAEVSRAHAAAQEMSWSHWLEQGEKNPHSAAHYGIYVFKPVSSLTLVDQGVDPYLGVSTWLEAHYQNPFVHRPVQDTPALARFADLTAATTLQLLLPLLIVLLAFQSFTGERERGTLRQVLSLGVPAGRLALGKVTGVCVALGLLLVPAALLGALALFTAGPGGGAVADPGVRFLLLAGAYLAYFLIFSVLAVGVSAVASSSRAALAILLVFWIGNGLLAPRLASDVARSQVELPSAQELQQAIQEDLTEGFGPHPSRDERRIALEDSVLRAHGVTSLEELPFNYAGLSLQSGEEFANLVFDRRFGDLAARIEAQSQLHRWIGLAAPHLAIRSLSMALAGTDASHHERFSSAAEEHRRLIQRVLNEDIMENGVYGETYVAGPDLWSDVPEFEYQGPPVAWAMAGQGAAWGALGLWLILGAVLAGRGAASLRRRT
jgi:ABC-2 type transport system permease protein